MIDANVTTLIAAIILFIFGSGPVKGFAVTLGVGIISTLFSAYFIARHLTSVIVLRDKEGKFFNLWLIIKLIFQNYLKQQISSQ